MITIQCASCKKQYNVDEKLAGKRVRCKGCGNAIAVSVGLEEDAPSSEPDISLSPPESTLGRGAGNACPSCGSAVDSGSVVCMSCGYNFKTGRGGKVGEIGLMATGDDSEKKQRRPRGGGSELLNSIDGYLGIAMFLLTVAGLGVWGFHMYKMAGGFSVMALLPSLIMLAVLAGVVAPLMMVAIKATAHFMNFRPRPDTYHRLMITLALPYGMSLLCYGHIGENPALATAMTGAWLATPVLFLYLFRDEVMEMVATAIAGAVSAGVSMGVVVFLSVLVPVVTGPLYAEALPGGPWSGFATGHMPPKAVNVASTQVKPAETQQSPTDTVAIAVNGNTVKAPPTTNEVQPGELFNHGPSSVKMPPTTRIGPDVPPVDPNEDSVLMPAPGAGAGENTAAVTAKAPKSPFVAQILTDAPELQGAREIVTPIVPSNWFLKVKRTDITTVTVERWSVEPLEKKGSLSYQEVPTNPNSFALSTKGDYLVVLSRYPKWQVEIANFDNKPSKKIDIVATLPKAAQGLAVPTLVGFRAAGYFIVRWDIENRRDASFQDYNALTGEAGRLMIVEPFEQGANGMAISPDGRTAATLTRPIGSSKELVFYDLIGGAAPRRLTPMAMDFTCKGLAFSPDGKKLAIVAATRDVTMLLCYGVAKLDTVSSVMLVDAPIVSRDLVGHGLLWMKSNPVWLLSGEELYDVELGKKIGSLGLPAAADQRLMGSESMIMQMPGEGERKYALVKFDDGAIKAGIEAVRKK